jgi:hypothetical protein
MRSFSRLIQSLYTETMPRRVILTSLILIIGLVSPIETSSAQGPGPQTLSLCLKLTPAGPNAKPPTVAQPRAGKKCDAGFNYYDFPDSQTEIAALNELFIGSFNTGLAIGVYSSIGKLKKPSPTPSRK